MTLEGWHAIKINNNNWKDLVVVIAILRYEKVDFYCFVFVFLIEFFSNIIFLVEKKRFTFIKTGII